MIKEIILINKNMNFFKMKLERYKIVKIESLYVNNQVYR